jgi:hypothetical protein
MFCMDRRDRELLEKQVGRIAPSPRTNGVMILAIFAVFFGGMVAGGFLFGNKSVPMLIASNDAAATMSWRNTTPPTMRP